MTKPPKTQELWASLKAFTPARVGIPSIAGALPTTTLLELQLGRARARDAVQLAVDFEALAVELRGRTLPTLKVHSAARDRATYVRYPALGRQLDDNSRRLLSPHRAAPPWDLTFVIADGLSGAAVTESALATVFACLPRLKGWRISPIVLAEQARVALADEIAALLDSQLSVILIGERPGLSVANSLGAYVTWAPRVGRQDADRNCVSNIHPGGASCDEAAHAICWVLEEARRRRCSGTTLKNEAGGPGLFGAPASQAIEPAD